jgi:hypothetical protein
MPVILATQEGAIRRMGFEASSGKTFRDPISTNTSGLDGMCLLPNYSRSINRKTAVQACPGINNEPLFEK